MNQDNNIFSLVKPTQQFDSETKFTESDIGNSLQQRKSITEHHKESMANQEFDISPLVNPTQQVDSETKVCDVCYSFFILST